MHEAFYVRVSQHDRSLYLCNLPAGLLTQISYAAVRGRDNETGSIQRLLNTRRISSIKNFALAGGDFPNSIVLNWVDEPFEVDEAHNVLRIPHRPRSAQLIDGQHRVAGLEEAIAEKPEFASFEIPCAIYMNLNTIQCAEIFLAINTEQKPVNRSLVFDLYGIVGEQLADQAVLRAQDIAKILNEVGAPYYGMIKFPGEKPRKGGVALSTVVTSIKPLVEKNGVLNQVGLSTFQNQSKLFMNYFETLRHCYGSRWQDRSNALMYASGFAGALDFLSKRILPYCVNRKSFTIETMREAINISDDNLILQSEVTGKGGTEAQRHVFSRLDDAFQHQTSADNFEI